MLLAAAFLACGSSLHGQRVGGPVRVNASELASTVVPVEALSPGSAANDAVENDHELTLAARNRCKIGHRSMLWLQTVVDAWQVVHDELGLLDGDVGVPWMIVYDGYCQWVVAAPPTVDEESLGLVGALAWGGRPVPIVGSRHRGTLVLPDERRIPARAMAFASAHHGNSFFVLAQRSLWAEDFPDARGEDLDRYFAGIAVHELIHTQQILKVQAQFTVLHAYSPTMPLRIDDNALSRTFAHEPDYLAALSMERELLHRAILAPKPHDRLAAVRQALATLCQRRARFHVGERAWATEVEDLMLAMEGMAVWVHFQVAQHIDAISATPLPVPSASLDQTAVYLAERATDYVQDAGFSMTYLVDVLAPYWPRRAAFDSLQSPVRMLEVAISPRGALSFDDWSQPACGANTAVSFVE